MYKFHKDGTLPKNGEVFVFGSNLAGIHGAGAAKIAKENFGAIWNVGIGLHGRYGRSYAIPTKNENFKVLDLFMIEAMIKDFIIVTKVNLHDNTQWFVTRVGCGLAGYKDEQIAPMFKGARNCSFAEEWRQYLE